MHTLLNRNVIPFARKGKRIHEMIETSTSNLYFIDYHQRLQR